MLYLGVIVLTFFLLIFPLLSTGATLMSLVHFPGGIRIGITQLMSQQEALRWGIVPHPDVAEFLHMFLRHVMNCLSGELGHSFLTLRSVAVELSERIINTALLVGGSLFASLLIGCGLVSYQERDERGRTSLIGKISAQIVNSSPTFWVGMMFLLLGSFILPEFIGVGFPQFGTIDYYVWIQSVNTGAGAFMICIDVLFHLFLPMAALTISGSFFIYSTLKSTLTDRLSSKQITVDEDRGIDQNQSFYMNLLSTLGAIKEWFPLYMCSIILIEVIFTWRGVGRNLFDAILRLDYPVIRGSIIVLSLFVILMHFIIDVSFSIMVWLEPNLTEAEKEQLCSANDCCCSLDLIRQKEWRGGGGRPSSHSKIIEQMVYHLLDEYHPMHPSLVVVQSTE